ncbi:MAG: beta-phosphoglucomutase [Bacteroidetes bacterium RBG_13_43_22]|nr:MAG: beta-phosphoglucomutase [Bacteroidetes bacterium RBG_13_43_22]
MNIRGSVFDLDGVIVDTAKYHFLAWKRLADQLNIPFTGRDNERLKGVSRMDSLDIILDIGGMKLIREEKERYARLKNEWYIDYISRMTPDEILPGSIEFIEELKSAGIKTALGSASKNTPMILERLGMEDLFDAVADGNIVRKTKPDPEVFLVAARMIDIKPAHCVVFEDAVAGVEAAHQAGMLCVGVGSEEVLKEADYIIPGLYVMNLRILGEIQKKRN